MVSRLFWMMQSLQDFSKFPLFFFCFPPHYQQGRGADRQTDSAASVHKHFPNTEGSCPGMCTGVQARSEIMALAIAKENKIDAICRACSF